MKPHRLERVAEEIHEEVARILDRDMKDPRIRLVTVTRVDLAPDLQTAKVGVGILGAGAERERALAALQQAAGFVRRELGRRIRMRHVPELRFELDAGLDATDRVAQLLAEIERSGPAKPEEP